MVSTASPPAGPVPRPSAVDRITTDLGRAFVDAIVAGDFDRLETPLAPDVRFRAIIPDEYQQASTAAGARALVEDWFGGTDPRELFGSTVDLVGDRLVVGYRLGLTEVGERRIVEQHVAAAVDGRQFRDLALVCSGFRPLATDPDGAVGTVGVDPSSGNDRHAGAPVFTPAARLDATGLSCATLTPTVSATVRGLDFGAVLEIVTDDPEAEEGLRSWTRLTGNELVAAEAGPGSARRFHIRRSPQDAAITTKKGTN
jgi:TusA-related sulfurtransferase